MKLTHISALGLCAATFGIGYGCSSPEVERQPINITTTSGGSTVQVMTGAGGKAVGIGSGGVSGTGGNKASGTGGMPVVVGAGGTNGGNTGGNSGATGGGLNLENCDQTAVAALFKQKRCNDCHAGFQTTDGLTGWIGKVGTKTQTMDCPNRTVVVPGSPNTSLLYIKLAGAPPAACGTQMPMPEGANKPLVPFTQQEVKCVSDWITRLAPSGAGGTGAGGGSGTGGTEAGGNGTGGAAEDL